jgi:hypothetical protein
LNVLCAVGNVLILFREILILINTVRIAARKCKVRKTMAKRKMVVCPECGGNLIYEAIGNYGTLYYVCKDGRIGRKLKSIQYDYSGDAMVYCAECGSGYEFRRIENGIELAEVEE